MNIKTVTPLLSVAPQIMPKDLIAIKEKGFKTIICNRPDGEGVDQPTYNKILYLAFQLPTDRKSVV